MLIVSVDRMGETRSRKPDPAIPVVPEMDNNRTKRTNVNVRPVVERDTGAILNDNASVI